MKRLPFPKGRPGDWFADVGADSFPCVHEKAIVEPRKSMHYLDPFPDKVPASKFTAYANAISTGKIVLLTKSKPELVNGHSSRDHYIALYRVDNVVVHPDQGIEFDFVERIGDWPRRT